MFQRILVPLDGSKHAEQSILVASKLARTCGGSIVFVRVVLPPTDFGKYAKQHSIAWERAAYETQHAEAASYLVNMTLRYGDEIAGIDVGLVIATGITAPAICSAARLEGADLIIMRSHAQSDFQRWLFGSVMQEVIRHSPIPTLILHEHGSAFSSAHTRRPFRVLVPLDGSPASEIALPPALQFLSAFGGQEAGELRLTRVLDVPGGGGNLRRASSIVTAVRIDAMEEADAYLKGIAERLYAEHHVASTLSITTSVIISTDIVGTIARQAEHHEEDEYAGGSDLIVIANHDHRGFERLFKGKVAKRMLNATRLPILVVHGQAEPAERSFR